MAKRKVAYIVRVDGSTELLPTTVAEMPLSTAQQCVGGYIEHVSIGIGDLWCNEEGLLKGLPFNRAASRVANMPVVGDVIIELKERVNDGS